MERRGEKTMTINKDTARFLLAVEEMREAVIAGGIVALSDVPIDNLGTYLDVDAVVYDDKDVLFADASGTIYPVVFLHTYDEPGQSKPYTWAGDRRYETYPVGFTILVHTYKDEDTGTETKAVCVRTGTLENALVYTTDDLDVIIDEHGRVDHLW